MEDQSQASPEEAPFKKWIVPLFVIPTAIGASMILILVLFFFLSAEESTPRENLDRVLYGGRNERQQAAMELQRQVQSMENPKAELDRSFVPDLLDAFEKSLKDPEEEPHVLALFSGLLGYLREPRAVPPLVQALEDSREYEGSGMKVTVQWCAAYALAQIGSPECLEPLRKLLSTSEDQGLRVVAAGGLGKIQDPQSQAALRAALRDPFRFVRWTAALGLAGFGDREALEPLREMLQVENAAYWKDPSQRQESVKRAIDAVVYLQDEDSLPLLHQLDLEERDLKIRDYAKKGIQKLEGADSIK